MQTVAFKTLLTNPAHLIATGFGVGLLPGIPGTCGALLAVPLYLLLAPLPMSWYLVVVTAVTLTGIIAAGKSARMLGESDPGIIVIDETAGMLIGFTAIPAGWIWLTVAFIMFRFLDIVKPWPVCLFDRYCYGGTGIMLDDIVAGIMTVAAVQLLAMTV